MSNEACGWVWRHSTYRGSQLLVALAIADVVNDANGNEFWMSTSNLAAKARVSRQTVMTALAQMVNDEVLTVVRSGAASRTPTLYRFTSATSALVPEATCTTVVHVPEATCTTVVHDMSNLHDVACTTVGHNTNRDIPREPNARARVKSQSLPMEDPLEREWAETWGCYPRREAKVKARAGYIASRKGGATHADLLLATRSYAAERARERDPAERKRFTMTGSTFFGSSERWRDYLHPVDDDDDPGPSFTDRLRDDTRRAMIVGWAQ